MKCKFCNKRRNSKKCLNEHIIHCTLNPERINYYCDLCHKEFENVKSFNGHKKGCGKEKKEYVRKKKETKTNCQFCGHQDSNPYRLGAHISKCLNNPNYDDTMKKIANAKRGPHTEETKKKLSEIRKRYLMDNPDKVPYKLNHSSKESFPEKYFSEVFQKENIRVEKYYQVGLYELDFCIPEKKIDIEIDGNQHYDDNKIVESDRRRTAYLEADGWDVIRIRWSDYNKLSHDEKSEFVKNLKKYIKKIYEEKPTIVIENKRICICGSSKDKKSKTCNKCRGLKDRKVERPTIEVLLKDIEILGYCGAGRKYNVTDNAIRKWIKNYKSEGLI